MTERRRSSVISKLKKRLGPSEMHWVDMPVSMRCHTLSRNCVHAAVFAAWVPEIASRKAAVGGRSFVAAP